MYDTPALASASHQAAEPGKVPRRRCGPTAPWRIVATWRERVRFRSGMEEMWKTAPHLIEDIGLRKWQVEAEIAKPFWRA